MRGLVVAAVTALAVLLPTAPAGAAAQVPPAPRESLVVLLDQSGSMREPDGLGSTRAAAAEAAVLQIVDALPDTLEVGLRAYGHRVPSEDKSAACRDTEALVPVGPLDRDRLRDAVTGLEPLGETPLGLSLQEVARDLPAGVPATVLVVSDGADECWTDGLGPEPCEAARDLVAGRDVRLETVGLLVEEAGRRQLECVAEVGGGSFTAVQDAADLADALAAAQVRGLRGFQVRGDPVAGGPALIDATVVGPGTYSDAVLAGEATWYAVDLSADEEVLARLTIRTAGVPADAGVSLEWQDAEARTLDLAVVDGVGSAQATTLALSSGPADGSRSRYGALRSVGRYHLAVRTSGFPPGVPHDLVLEVVERSAEDDREDPADPSGAPGTAAATPALTATPAPTGTSGGGGAAEQAADLPPPPRSGAGAWLVLPLLAVAGATVWLLRRRRRQDAPHDDRPAYL